MQSVACSSRHGLPSISGHQCYMQETAGMAHLAGGPAAAAPAEAGAEAALAAPGRAAGGNLAVLQAGPDPEALREVVAGMTVACLLLAGLTPDQLRLAVHAPSARVLAACSPMGELSMQVLLSTCPAHPLSQPHCPVSSGPHILW